MSSHLVHVVLLESSGNQAFVFHSNKLREISGASYLIRRSCTDWALEAASLAGMTAPAPHLANFDTMTTAKRAGLLDKATRIEQGATVEPVVCTSGKAVFLATTKDAAEDIVYRVTRRALEDAPGLVLRGAVSAAISLDDTAENAGRLVKGLFATVEGLRLTLPPAEARFPLQPMVEPCRTTGWPGEHAVDAFGREVVSDAAMKKRVAAKDAIGRCADDLDMNLVRDMDQLDKALGLKWRGVVHADGNGFGKVFLGLADYCQKGATARAFFDLFRDLSVSLDLVGVAALKAASEMLKEVAGKVGKVEAKGIPLLVNVMGGDDLSVICDGGEAVGFAAAYLQAFERLVDEPEIGGRKNAIPFLQHREGDAPDRFGAAAGIAIAKPHHPVHRAYDLAEELTKSAKSLIKRDFNDPTLAALDFQVVFGDSTSDLAGLRDGLVLEKDNKIRAHARPYVTTGTARMKKFDAAKAASLAPRHYSMLDEAGKALRRSDNAAALPRSQQHVLREAVLAGKAVADARLKLMASRYPGARLDIFGKDCETLFFEHNGLQLTRLLDAMDIVGVEADRDDDAANREDGA